MKSKYLCISVLLIIMMPYIYSRVVNTPLRISTKFRGLSSSVGGKTALGNINLTPEEQKLFQLLKEVGDLGNKTTVRIAGGWVRDKLLGLKGKRDIDVVLDNITGSQFAHKLNMWNRQKRLPSISIGVIQSNPDKSKHLDTATAKIGDFSVDFVNLRSEKYAQTSRIPVVEFGTPEQDAFRRDFTVNSLFFNLNTNSVEDFTGLGLKDLQNRVIRTPLTPEDTFHDDPLRVIRMIRFACRLNFTIAPECVQSVRLNSGKLNGLLRSKVSVERIGEELKQMLSSAYDDSGWGAVRAVTLLNELQILTELMKSPDIMFQLRPEQAKSNNYWTLRRIPVRTPEDTSSCVGVCQIDKQTKYCKGCVRTIEEISTWSQLSRDDKIEVSRKLEARKPWSMVTDLKHISNVAVNAVKIITDMLDETSVSQVIERYPDIKVLLRRYPESNLYSRLAALMTWSTDKFLPLRVGIPEARNTLIPSSAVVEGVVRDTSCARGHLTKGALPLSNWLLSELKFSKKEIGIVSNVEDIGFRVSVVLDKMSSNIPVSRSELASILRDAGSVDMFYIGVQVAMMKQLLVVALSNNMHDIVAANGVDRDDGISKWPWSVDTARLYHIDFNSLNNQIYNDTWALFNKFVHLLRERRILGVEEELLRMKLPLNGVDMRKLFSDLPDKDIGKYLNLQALYILEYPAASVQDIISYLTRVREISNNSA